MDRRVLAPALIIPLLILSFAGGYLASRQLAGNNTRDNVIEIIPIVRIYKDGNLIYEKVGDPPTNNLAHLFFVSFASRIKTDGSAFTIAATSLAGTAASLDPDDTGRSPDEHYLWVLAGTDTNPPSYNDATMEIASYDEAKVVNYYFDSTTNEWVMQLTGTITFSATYNITSVGLATDSIGGTGDLEYHNPVSYPDKNLLIFRDLLPTPITVANGDSISVQYEIHFKLP